MILARNVQGFGLFGPNILLGAFNAGVTKQQLGRAQVVGLLIDMGREGPTQRMQAIEAGIEAGLFQPGLEQPSELAFAQVCLRPPCSPPREQPAMQRLFRVREIGLQAVACARGQPRLHRARIACLGFSLPDFDDFAHPGKRGDIDHPQPYQVRAPEAGVEGNVEQRKITQSVLMVSASSNCPSDIWIAARLWVMLLRCILGMLGDGLLDELEGLQRLLAVKKAKPLQMQDICILLRNFCGAGEMFVEGRVILGPERLGGG
ncbi:hypothetical protein SULPSESMR1_04993 (plasmid) [Pseudosulfitobacter pseudonitzschiae]|uniref:Uncharacterized protein n=1 Tax=Pseudosulfitobacter pseudonitzschiae TaxID=1402135 RepID=A0A221K758_9RHOB|nr:hypothetical protein SULPSESMR1_04993 [Pseudosulfitobacter pseudonitzschiae]